MSDNFEPFAKIARLSRECVITEKIDGTNAQIYLVPTTELFHGKEYPDAIIVEDFSLPGSVAMFVGSRNRWIQPGCDNFGFAMWAKENFLELKKLGPGRHFGEWWGAGIQRRYGLTEKRFSLFNVDRWGPGGKETQPMCCHVVPVLYRGAFNTMVIDGVLDSLRERGSEASPGFMKPEGIVIWHTAARVLFKKTIEGDEKPKGKTE